MGVWSGVEYDRRRGMFMGSQYFYLTVRLNLRPILRNHRQTDDRQQQRSRKGLKSAAEEQQEV